jgi:hypothetical protein
MYHVIITQASHWSAGHCPAENGLLLLRSRYRRHLRMRRIALSHVHAPTRRKRFHSTVASSCWGTTSPLSRNALSKSVTILCHRNLLPKELQGDINVASLMGYIATEQFYLNEKEIVKSLPTCN